MDKIFFEDAASIQLAPINLTRPSYAISCGGLRLVDWFDEPESTITAFVRPHLQTIQLNDWPNFVERPDSKASVLLVNARLAPTVSNISQLQSFVSDHADNGNQVSVARNGWAVAAAIVPEVIASKLNRHFETDRFSELQDLANANSIPLTSSNYTIALFDYPHDVIQQHLEHCNSAVEHRIKHGSWHEVQDGVFVAVGPSGELKNEIPSETVFDTSSGPVLFESNVKVGPFCFFRGPVHIGKNSKISEHASIKDAVAISHTCKIGGEVEGVQIEPWTNKQHYGFLGHSYLGSWINLGAGTCNSDLKNTYGTINMQYGDRKVSTGMQFVGCVMGDYSRTAINTSIYTGKTIGVGSTVYGMTASNVPSFVNVAQSLRQTGILPVQVLMTIQKRMFDRRNVAQRPCDIQLLHDVFGLTASERDPNWTSDPINF
jgi:glucose-1-phosphate thymidylyltransferase